MNSTTVRKTPRNTGSSLKALYRATQTKTQFNAEHYDAFCIAPLRQQGTAGLCGRFCWPGTELWSYKLEMPSSRHSTRTGIRLERKIDPPHGLTRSLREAGFAHMTRMATGAKTEGSKGWIAEHLGRRRQCKSPKGEELCKELRHERKALAGGRYQLLTSNSEMGDYLCSET